MGLNTKIEWNIYPQRLFANNSNSIGKLTRLKINRNWFSGCLILIGIEKTEFICQRENAP